MAAQLVVVVVVIPFDGRLLDCSVHSLDLAVRPGMVRLGQPMFDFVLRQVLSNIGMRRRAVGPFLRDGWSQNCTPLSVRTVRILYGTAWMSALRKVEAE